MCGIAGILGAPQDERTRGTARAMVAAIRHRGPDAGGLYQDDTVALGVRRLSIIDLVTGDQPISNERGDVWVVYNGEMYNFAGLREELRTRGHRFRTGSDTEVVVHAYEEYGRDCVRRFDGMFAFVLWDRRDRTALLARDRFGKKPLYYTAVDGQILFASEIQAFLAHPGFVARPDAVALRSYLAYGVVTTERAALAGVRRVPAASTMLWSGAPAAPQRYWRLDHATGSAISFDDAVRSFRERFQHAVASRLVSDVPVGAFLSGGLDSSSVVAAMAKASPERVRTFSVGFGERGYSELHYARAVAERFGTEHVEEQVTASAAEILPTLMGHFGEPFADASAVPTYMISRVAGSHLKVVLSGDGGDELLGGYRRQQIADRSEALHRSPASLIGRVVDRMHGGMTPRSRTLRVMQALGKPLPERYIGWRTAFNATERDRLYGDLLRDASNDVTIDPHLLGVLEDDRLTAAQRVMAADLEHYLVFDLMPKTDITSMACSLEVRCPFLDRSLLEFLAALPPGHRLGGGTSKRVLRAAMANELPPLVLWRGKQGFDVPVDQWVAGDLRRLAQDCLLSGESTRRGLVDAAAARDLMAAHRVGDLRSGQQIWTLVVLEMWARAYLDGTYRPAIADGPLALEVIEREAAASR